MGYYEPSEWQWTAGLDNFPTHREYRSKTVSHYIPQPWACILFGASSSTVTFFHKPEPREVSVAEQLEVGVEEYKTKYRSSDLRLAHLFNEVSKEFESRAQIAGEMES